MYGCVVLKGSFGYLASEWRQDILTIGKKGKRSVFSVAVDDPEPALAKLTSRRWFY
jgi:hypothetical protein